MLRLANLTFSVNGNHGPGGLVLADGQAGVFGEIDVQSCSAFVGDVEVRGRDVGDELRVLLHRQVYQRGVPIDPRQEH